MDSQGSIKNTLIAQLFQQNYDWLCKKLSYQTGCSHSAEDLAAEAFLQVWMLPDPASIRSPRAFLATIAQRLMYESWRRKDLERAYLQILAEAPEAVQPSPHEQWMLIESLQAIDRLLDGLSGQARAVFLMSQLEGLTYVQIGERLGLSLGRIHQLMKDALHCCYRAWSAGSRPAWACPANWRPAPASAATGCWPTAAACA